MCLNRLSNIERDVEIVYTRKKGVPCRKMQDYIAVVAHPVGQDETEHNGYAGNELTVLVGMLVIHLLY